MTSSRRLSSLALVPFIFIFIVCFFVLEVPKFPLQLTFTRRPPRKSSHPLNITLITLSDQNFGNKYRTQINSIHCYANLHNYTHLLINPKGLFPPCANYSDFFFLKHCTVAYLLEKHPDIDIAVVLDADIISGNPAPLDPWIESPSDLVFYERSWNSEIMSGAYIVSNTAFARHFLKYWASFEFVKPPGFSSSDNGAIHLAVIDALALKGRKSCRKLYDELEASVRNLNPYYKFVACTKHLLGPARVYKAATKRAPKGIGEALITIYPRMFGPAIDGEVHPISRELDFHPFYHGVKKSNWPKDYGLGSTKTKACRKSSPPRISPADRATQVVHRKQLRRDDEGTLFRLDPPFGVVPRWGHLRDDCFDTFCTPLPSPAVTYPQGYVVEDGKLVTVDYVDPGVDDDGSFWSDFDK